MGFRSGSMSGKGLGTTKFGNGSDVVYVLVSSFNLMINRSYYYFVLLLLH